MTQTTHVKTTTHSELIALGFSEPLVLRTLAYLDALNVCDANGVGTRHGGRYAHYYVEPSTLARQKYVRVVMDTNPGGDHGRSVHAFIVKSSGQLVKPAGWQGPAKSTAAGKKGEFLSNYTLTDDDSFAKLLVVLTDPGAWTGGYLYQR